MDLNRKLQLVELDLLIEMDRICRKYNITYTMAGGTLIGAVRHHGFIPWDDDVDIVMGRDEYEKFSEVCEFELDAKKYFWQTQETDKEYRLVYGRLRRNGTKWVKKGRDTIKMHQGINIDVFPADHYPDSRWETLLYIKLIMWLKTAMWSKIGSRSEPGLKRYCYFLVSIIPHKVYYTFFKLIIKKLNSKPTACDICYGNPFLYQFLSSKYPQTPTPRIYSDGTAIELEFENHNFYAPKAWHEYLTRAYGDYMTPPPEEERHGHTAVMEIDFGDISDEEANSYLQKFY